MLKATPIQLSSKWEPDLQVGKSKVAGYNVSCFSPCILLAVEIGVPWPLAVWLRQRQNLNLPWVPELYTQCSLSGKVVIYSNQLCLPTRDLVLKSFSRKMLIFLEEGIQDQNKNTGKALRQQAILLLSPVLKIRVLALYFIKYIHRRMPSFMKKITLYC